MKFRKDDYDKPLFACSSLGLTKNFSGIHDCLVTAPQLAILTFIISFARSEAIERFCRVQNCSSKKENILRTLIRSLFFYPVFSKLKSCADKTCFPDPCQDSIDLSLTVSLCVNRMFQALFALNFLYRKVLLPLPKIIIISS